MTVADDIRPLQREARLTLARALRHDRDMNLTLADLEKGKALWARSDYAFDIYTKAERTEDDTELTRQLERFNHYMARYSLIQS